MRRCGRGIGPAAPGNVGITNSALLDSTWPDNAGIGEWRVICLAACTQRLLRRDWRCHQEERGDQREFLHLFILGQV